MLNSIENKTSVTTHFKTNNRKQHVYCLSYCHILQFTSNVQCAHLAGGQLDDALLKYAVTEVFLFSVVAFKTLTFHKVV